LRYSDRKRKSNGKTKKIVDGSISSASWNSRFTNCSATPTHFDITVAGSTLKNVSSDSVAMEVFPEE
jgi:hypothetical protein